MYIKAVQVRNFWQEFDIKWVLREDVNILIGENGVGKTTLLNLIYEALKAKEVEIDENVFNGIDDIAVSFPNNSYILFDAEGRKRVGNIDISQINIQKIATFDTNESLTKQLLSLKEAFFRYQRDLLKQIEILFSEPGSENIAQKSFLEVKAEIFGKKNIFIKIINELFENTEKTFDEENFVFIRKGHKTPLEIEKLSSGEKQVMLILLTTLLQKGKKSILLLDEPEISLHLDWQRRFIRDVRALNENCQLIITTHSPSIYFNGWNHCKLDVMEIVEKITSENDITLVITEHAEELSNLKKALKYEATSLFERNQMISMFYGSLNLNECKILINFIKDELSEKADSYTYTTLMGKIPTIQGRKALFDEMKKQKIAPTVVTFNVLIKKSSSVEEGLAFLTTMQKNKITPDIITFSTLLGKAKTMEEINLIEEGRKYFGVPVNELYSKKLLAKY